MNLKKTEEREKIYKNNKKKYLMMFFLGSLTTWEKKIFLLFKSKLFNYNNNIYAKEIKDENL